jgi:hypothetical protein
LPAIALPAKKIKTLRFASITRVCSSLIDQKLRIRDLSGIVTSNPQTSTHGQLESKGQPNDVNFN